MSMQTQIYIGNLRLQTQLAEVGPNGSRACYHISILAVVQFLHNSFTQLLLRRMLKCALQRTKYRINDNSAAQRRRIMSTELPNRAWVATVPGRELELQDRPLQPQAS